MKLYDRNVKLPIELTLEDLNRLIRTEIDRAKLYDFNDWYMTFKDAKEALQMSENELRKCLKQKAFRSIRFGEEKNTITIIWKPDILLYLNTLDEK